MFEKTRALEASPIVYIAHVDTYILRMLTRYTVLSMIYILGCRHVRDSGVEGSLPESLGNLTKLESM
jgi:hypothetical protein